MVWWAVGGERRGRHVYPRWTSGAKNWPLTSRLKEAAQVSIECLEEADRNLKQMEYDFMVRQQGEADSRKF
eukprot:11051361-Prorocentrum_lima.AAC.1